MFFLQEYVLMISRGRKRRGYWQKRRSRNSIFPILLTAIIVGGIVLWIGKTLWQFTSTIRSEQTSSLMNIVQGSVEVSLADTNEWTTGASDTKFITGDKLRTQNNSEASLTLFDRSIIFLNENTEVQIGDLTKNSKGRQTANIKLIKGELWVNVDETSFQNKGSSFVVETPTSDIHVRGTLFDVKVSETQETIRLIRGKVDVDVYTAEERKAPQAISVGVGQKLVLNADTKQKIQEGQEVLSSVDNSFTETDWHLDHLEQFFPEEASQIRRRIEIATPTPPISTTEEETDNTPTDESLTPPTITTPADGEVIPAQATDIKVEGTAPPEAEFITVNGYTLTKYIPGDRKWSYFASTKFGTLVPGENTYTVVATTRDGRKSPESSIKITYEGIAPVAETPSTDASTSTNPDFAAPVITRPATGSFNDAYQTSSQIITITGLVDPKTQSVEVNGFKLRKFRAGKTEFSYIANANYGNLREGENTYTVTAFGENGVSASTSVKIIYTPIDIGQ